MTVPAVLGVSPRSDAKMAFSTGPTICFSHGVIVIERASVIAMLAHCVSGISAP